MENIFNSGMDNKVVATKIDYIPSIEEVDFHRDYPFTNLKMFGIDKENRPSEYDDLLVRQYSKQMLNGNWFFDLNPINVGINSHNIFNGEHRRKAIELAMEKGLKPTIWVKFFDDTSKLKEKRQALNGGKHYNCDDWCRSHIQAGRESFVFLNDFCLDINHPQLHSSRGKAFFSKGAIVLGETYSGFKDAYQSGDWVIPHKNLQYAEKKYTEMVRIKKALGYDEAGQDCWIYFGTAWNQFSKKKEYMDRIKNLQEGIEDFYDALKYVDHTNSNKTDVWFDRFVEALEYAEKHS